MMARVTDTARSSDPAFDRLVSESSLAAAGADVAVTGATADTAAAGITAFIARWAAAAGTERANYQLFVTELCDLLGVPKPDPARIETRDNAYVFERRVEFAHGDGTRGRMRVSARQGPARQAP